MSMKLVNRCFNYMMNAISLSIKTIIIIFTSTKLNKPDVLLKHFTELCALHLSMKYFVKLSLENLKACMQIKHGIFLSYISIDV